MFADGSVRISSQATCEREIGFFKGSLRTSRVNFSHLGGKIIQRQGVKSVTKLGAVTSTSQPDFGSPGTSPLLFSVQFPSVNSRNLDAAESAGFKAAAEPYLTALHKTTYFGKFRTPSGHFLTCTRSSRDLRIPQQYFGGTFGKV